MRGISLNERKYASRNPLRRVCLRNFERTIRALVRTVEPVSVLDAGCGEGMSLDNVSRLGPAELHGAELRLGTARQASLRVPRARIISGDVLALPYPPQSFDLVMCLEVLEHLPKPELAFAELTRVTRGRVLVSVPHEPFFRLGNFLTMRNFTAFGDDPDHRHHWCSQTFRRFLGARATIEVFRQPFPWLVALLSVPEG